MKRNKLRRFTRPWLFGLYTLFIVCLFSEIALRIYNPFSFRVKGDELVLDVNRKHIIQNKRIPILPKEIIVVRNSLGFRGEDKPADHDKKLSVITVGGSTTEGNFLGEQQTWSYHLFNKLSDSFNFWGNNAGFAGHSTFGHNVLVRDYLLKLKPKVILFLIGCNDIERDDLSLSDKSNMTGHYKDFFTYLSKKSELCNVVGNLVRHRRAVQRQVTDRYFDLEARKNDTLLIPQQIIDNRVRDQQRYLPAYEQRVESLVQQCRANNILPVLCTQPSLFGVGKDSITGTSLETFRISDTTNGVLWWKIQEVYNDVVRQVAMTNNVVLIDLAQLIPKSSQYFYDHVHFNIEGSEKVGEILYWELYPLLRKDFPGLMK